MISQFFVLSGRGDTIISRIYRGDVPRDSPAVFFRKVKFWGGEAKQAPPVFFLNGVSYIWIRCKSLYIMCTTRMNVSPSLIVELLDRFSRVFRDYCGVLTEESIRLNFVLIYELLDELIDYGYPQDSSTENLKSKVFYKPNEEKSGSSSSFILKKMSSFKLPQLNPKSTPSSSVNKPITGSGARSKKNEMFVDIIERISVTFNSSGYATHSEIDGTIQMKSFLSGNPELRLALNEELVVGKNNGGSQYGAIVMDDCNFHECVRLDEFESNSTLAFQPPDGEFVLMNYRITSPFRAPFRVFSFIELISEYKMDVLLRVRADLPETKYGSNFILEMPTPKSTSSCNWEWVDENSLPIPGQAVEYESKTRLLRWKIRKFPGAKEIGLRVKLSFNSPQSASVKKEVGPVGLSFDIPMFNVSNVVVRFLRIAENDQNYKAYRWIRYMAKTSSYICRI